MKIGIYFIFFTISTLAVKAQIATQGCYLSGALLQQNPLAGCGNSPNYCNLASLFVPAFSPSACGTSTLSGGATYTLNTSMVLPSGCTATIQAQYMKRNNYTSPVNPSGTGCSNCGMDGSPDAIKILSSGGTILSQSSTLAVNVGTCAAYPSLGTYTTSTASLNAGCNNADATVEMIVTGGTFSVGGVSNRSDEFITYTINMSGTCGPSCNLVLPVELAKFNAELVEGKVLLNWSTFSERNLFKFIIEKSADAIHWENLAEIIPTGRKYDVFSYSTEDVSPYSGLNFYRLVSIDLDGSSQRSGIVSVEFNRDLQYWYLQDDQTLNLFFSEEGNYQVQLFDLNGRKVYEENVIHGKTKSISKESIVAGMYLLSLNGTKNYKNKIIFE